MVPGREFRRCGLNPLMTQTNGFCEVKFDNIDMYYPARPTKQVLNQMSLEIPSHKTHKIKQICMVIYRAVI